jgi:tripartite-type tricarboxylate transporter receptor subunit TctC
MLVLGLFGANAVANPSDDFPNKAVRIVVPFAAGGGGDFIARAWADKFSETIKQPVIVENRGGGNTVVGTEVVARAAPDGYTLLLVGASIATNPALIEKLPYKTPTVIVNKLNQALAISLGHPDAFKRLAVIDDEVRLSSPVAFEKLLNEEITRWAKLYKPTTAAKAQ